MVKLKGNDSPMFYGAKYTTFRKAEELRENMTEAEKILWERIKDNQILGLKFRRQHPVSQFIVDFYCHRIRLVIEVDGEIHQTTENKEYDTNRTYELEKFGIQVIRFLNDEVINNTKHVVNEIINKCKELKEMKIE